MPPRSSHAETEHAPVSLLHPIHAGRYSLHGGTAKPPGAPILSTRPGERPAHPADVAQSTLFEAVLVAEIDELEDRAAAAERRWQRRSERTPDAVVILPTELTELRQRITEAGRMLDALRTRFPSD